MSYQQGPVYKVKWSPLFGDAFLSCSADWSVRLWHQDKSNPVMTFLSSTVREKIPIKIHVSSGPKTCYCPLLSSIFLSCSSSTIDFLIYHIYKRMNTRLWGILVSDVLYTCTLLFIYKNLFPNFKLILLYIVYQNWAI